MATQLKIVLVTCLLVCILMEDAKPVLAKKGGGRFKKLQDRVNILEEEQKCKGKYKDRAKCPRSLPQKDYYCFKCIIKQFIQY